MITVRFDSDAKIEVIPDVLTSIRAVVYVEQGANRLGLLMVELAYAIENQTKQSHLAANWASKDPLKVS